MRFISLYRPKKKEGAPPNQQEMTEMGKLIEDGFKTGVLLSTEGLQASSKGALVRLSEGKLTVTDGPFSETKELIGGYAILRVNSKEEAIELAKTFLKIAGDGETEIRQLHEPSDFSS